MEEHQTASVSLSSPYSTNNLPELKTASGATCTVTTDNLETIFEFMSQLETACGIDRNNEMSTPDEDANSLSRLAADSDIIPEVDLVVVRKYPLLFYMKKGDGHLVEYLSEREFEIQTDQQRLLAETEYQKLLPEVEARVRDQVIPKPPSRPYSNLLDDTDDEELLSHFLNSDDNDLWVCLSAEKRASLEKTKLRLDDQIRVNISAEMERLLQLKPWKLDAKPVLRLRVVTPQAFRSGRSCDPGAVLSFWNQPQVVAESIEEGEVYRFLQIKNSGIKNPQDLKLVFTGESRFEHLESIPQLSPFTRRLSTIAEILTFKVQAPFQEIDTAGKVIKVCDDDCAILRDQHGNEMKIQFHKPLKTLGLLQLIKVNEVIFCFNVGLPKTRHDIIYSLPTSCFKSGKVLTKYRQLYLMLKQESEEVDEQAIVSNPKKFCPSTSTPTHTTPKRSVVSIHAKRLFRKFTPPRKVHPN